jgi:hypothetical protein
MDLQPSPPVLSEEAPWGVDPGPALAAWTKWAAVPDLGLLTEARHLVEHPDAGTAGVWPRAAALLAGRRWSRPWLFTMAAAV